MSDPIFDHSSEHPIRVLIVDDQEIVRSGLTAFLFACQDMECAGEARNGADAIKLCDQVEPDVVLMDLVMPIMDGVEATRAILATHPKTRVIALTSFGDEDLMHGVLDAGAIGYIIKTVSAAQLADAIRAAHQGKSTLYREIRTG